MNKVIIFLWISFVWPNFSNANDTNDVQASIKRLNQIIAQNERNDLAGKSNLNQYVFFLEEKEELAKKESWKYTDDNIDEVLSRANDKLLSIREERGFELFLLIDGSEILYQYSSEREVLNSTKLNEENKKEIKEKKQGLKAKAQEIFLGSRAGSSSALTLLAPIEIIEFEVEKAQATLPAQDEKLSVFYFTHIANGKDFDVDGFEDYLRQKFKEKSIANIFPASFNNAIEKVVELLEESYSWEVLEELEPSFVASQKPLVKESFIIPDGAQFNSVTEADLNTIIESMADDLVEAVTNYPQDEDKLYDKGNDYHIINRELLQLENYEASDKQYEILSDKLEYLKEIENVDVYVIYHPCNFILSREDNSYNYFAEAVYNKVESQLNNDKFVLITIPYAYPKTITNNNFQYLMPGLYATQGVLNYSDINSLNYDTSFDLVYNVYKNTEKPYNLYYGVLNVDGSIEYYKKSISRSRNKGAINEIIYYINPGFNSLRSLKVPEYNSIKAANGQLRDNDPFGNEFFKYEIDIYLYNINRDLILQTYQNARPDNSWIKSANSIKEKYIEEYFIAYGHEFIFNQSDFLVWLNSFAELATSDSYSFVGPPWAKVPYQKLIEYQRGNNKSFTDITYDFDAFKVIDPIAYTLFDAAGLIPGIDNAADAFGLIYAIGRGDEENATAYFVGISVVGGGAVVIKGFQKTGKFIYKGVLLAVKNSSGRVIKELAAKQVNYLCDLFKIQSPSVFPAEILNPLHEAIENKSLTKELYDEVIESGTDTRKIAKLKEVMQTTALSKLDDAGGLFKDLPQLKTWYNSPNLTTLQRSNIKEAFGELDIAARNRIEKVLTDNDSYRQVFGELLVKLGNGNTTILKQISGSGWQDLLPKLLADLDGNSIFKTKFFDNLGLSDAWGALGEFPNLRNKISNLETLEKVKGRFIYNGKTGQAALEEIFTGHKSAQMFIDNLNEAEELFEGVGIKQWSGIKSAGEARVVNDAGVVIGKVDNGKFTVTASKGSIPDPSTYLDNTYISNHIGKFKQEGAGFIVVKSWTEGGNPLYTTLPSRKFVGLRSEMDEVITKYKAQGNDWTVLRDELNLGASTDLSNEEIFYIKINGDDTRFSYELPNGNEGYPNPSGGAIVGEWKPGGYTKNGTAEAALIGSENIVHNKDINQLLNNFSGMWEKIK